MKSFIFTFLILLLTVVTADAQKTRTINAGDITENTTWYADTIYTLNGYIYVKNNATLTIEPGTIIKGGANRSTLVITRYGNINAVGSKTRPIVFTSSKDIGQRAPGDWGGVVILGKAVINRPTDCSTCPGSGVAATEPGIQNAIEGDLDNANGDGLYGGIDNNHSSGKLSYVRIEFGGIVITPGNEINGLTLGGVGKGTTIDHIQVTQANDDGIEWFGGNVDAKYLVSHHNIDDDFDTDFGFTGNVQFGICQRDSNWYDIGSGPTTNGFESDNDGSGSSATPNTEATFSNMTIIGPLANGVPLGYSNSFQNGARLRRNTSQSIFNSVFMGWPDAVFIDGTTSGAKHQNDTLLFKNNILAGNLRAVNNSSSPSSSVARSKVFANNNDSLFSAIGVLIDAFNYTAPDYRPASSSIANSGASFNGNKISNTFFTPTSYRGAMGSENWTDCWCKFDPQNENYNTAPINYPKAMAIFTAGSPNGGMVTFSNNSTNAAKYKWDFGASGNADTSSEANPVYIYTANGTFNVMLVAINPCGNDTLVKTVTISAASVKNAYKSSVYRAYPNPASNELTVEFLNRSSQAGTVMIFDAKGQVVATENVTDKTKFNLSELANGLYILRVSYNNVTYTDKLIINK